MGVVSRVVVPEKVMPTVLGADGPRVADPLTVLLPPPVIAPLDPTYACDPDVFSVGLVLVAEL